MPLKNTDPAREEATDPPVARAGWLKVAGIVVSGLFMIGRNKTWSGERERATPVQIVVGALIGGAVLVASLIALVRFVLSAAGQ
jgi:hypothetical protein